MTFQYTGPVHLRSAYNETECTVHVALAEDQEYIETVDEFGRVNRMPGMHSWGGVARVPGMVYGLLDLLGGEVVLTLPDGRTGKAFLTGYSQESVWVVEIQGAGPPPQ